METAKEKMPSNYKSNTIICFLLIFLVTCKKDKFESLEIERNRHNQYQIKLCSAEDTLVSLKDLLFTVSYITHSKKQYTCLKKFTFPKSEEQILQKCFFIPIDSCPNLLKPSQSDFRFVDNFIFADISELFLQFYDQEGALLFRREVGL